MHFPWGLQYQRAAQAGKDLRRSPVQRPAQAGSAVRPGQATQGFIQSSFENLQGWRCQKPPCATYGTRSPHGEKVFPYIRFEYLISTYACCSSTYCHTQPQGAWIHLLNALPIGIGELLLGRPASQLFSRPNKPQSCSLSSQGKCSSP